MAYTGVVVLEDLPSGNRRPASFVLIALKDRFFAVTCAHVLAPFLRKGKIPKSTRIGISTGYGRDTLERFKDVFTRNQDEGGAEPIDIGILEIATGNVQQLGEKRFLSECMIHNGPPPRKGTRVLYRGFANSESTGVFSSQDPEKLNARPLISEAPIVAKGSRTIYLAEPKGADVPKGLDLHGISGSGLFDMSFRLRGLIWGGRDGQIGALHSTALMANIHSMINDG